MTAHEISGVVFVKNVAVYYYLTITIPFHLVALQVWDWEELAYDGGSRSASTERGFGRH